MNYSRFVIIGEERTGSTLLILLLASHENVEAYGELFNPSEATRKKNIRLIKPIEINEDPIEYLEKHVFRKNPDKIKAIGFKLFYTHAKNSYWGKVWSYLKQTNTKIIHLKRNNLLDRYLSLQLAIKTDKWISFKTGENTLDEPISIDFVDCIKRLHKSLWFWNWVDNYFKSNPKIEIVYENLCSNLIQETKRIQDFLELDFQELKIITAKQRIKKKSELILNYSELKNQFQVAVTKGNAPKEWLDFFDE